MGWGAGWMAWNPHNRGGHPRSVLRTYLRSARNPRRHGMVQPLGWVGLGPVQLGKQWPDLGVFDVVGWQPLGEDSFQLRHAAGDAPHHEEFATEAENRWERPEAGPFGVEDLGGELGAFSQLAVEVAKDRHRFGRGIRVSSGYRPGWAKFHRGFGRR